MRISSRAIVAVVGASVLAARVANAQAASVPVEREPNHVTVFQNRYVQAFRVRLAPGQASLMHTHVRDDAAVRMSAATTTSQNLGEPVGQPDSFVPGLVTARNNERTPTTHRVHNVGTTPFDVMDVQALERPAGPEGPPAAAPAGENPRMRVYRFELEPGGRSAEHIHIRPYLRVAATAMDLETAEPGGPARRDRLGVGAFHWVETKVTHTLVNVGKQKGILVEFELR